MFSFRGSVVSDRLLVQATISVHPREARVSDDPAGSGRPVLMMVDTGARFSVVAADIVTSLGVVPVGAADVRTSMHPAEPRPVYRVVVSLDLDDSS